MQLKIDECVRGYDTLASWFSGSLITAYRVAPYSMTNLDTKTGILCGPFEITETLRHPSGALVRCLFHGWNENEEAISLTVGFIIIRGTSNWGTLGLDHAVLTEETEPPPMTWDQQLTVAGVARMNEDEFFAPLERMFLLSHWLKLSERSMYRLPGLWNDRIKWELERKGLAREYGRDASNDSYEYSRRRLGNRVEKLEAKPVPWAASLAADTAAPSSRANIMADLRDSGITVSPFMN